MPRGLTQNRIKFTDRTVKGLRPNPERQVEYWDETFPGFGVRVSPGGRRVWVCSTRVKGDPLQRKLRITIGRVDVTPLAVARQRARELMSSAEAGLDPRPAKPTEMPLTFAELGERYVEFAKSKKRTWRDDQRRLKSNILRELRGSLADEVDGRTIRKILRDHAQRAPVGADRVHETVRRLFNWAIAEELISRSDNPAAGISKFADPSKGIRDRVLNDDELKRFWLQLEEAGQQKPVEVGLIKCMALLGARRGELTRLQWDDLTSQKIGADDVPVWVAPAERTKTKEAYRTPLPPKANEIIQVQRGNGQTLVFPGVRGGPMASTNVIRVFRKVCNEAGIEDFVPHDLRHQCGTGIASLGFPAETISRVLNHKIRGTTSRYNAYDYVAEKFRALSAWERRLLEVVGDAPSSSKVIQFNG